MASQAGFCGSLIARHLYELADGVGSLLSVTSAVRDTRTKYKREPMRRAPAHPTCSSNMGC